jgi:cytochrome oxidase assembly protein ShyY1
MPARWPLVPTLLTALAVPTMVGLGVWQLERALWKEGLLARLNANANAPELRLGEASIPPDAGFRRVVLWLDCPPAPPTPSAARLPSGRPGYGWRLSCRAGDGGFVTVNLGASAGPLDAGRARALGQAASGRSIWRGVLVERPGGAPGWLLVSADPVAPLEPAEPPTLDTIPNNHRGYAVQWFGFAATLAIIFALWLRRWRRGRAA